MKKMNMYYWTENTMAGNWRYMCIKIPHYMLPEGTPRAELMVNRAWEVVDVVRFVELPKPEPEEEPADQCDEQEATRVDFNIVSVRVEVTPRMRLYAQLAGLRRVDDDEGGESEGDDDADDE